MRLSWAITYSQDLTQKQSTSMMMETSWRKQKNDFERYQRYSNDFIDFIFLFIQ